MPSADYETQFQQFRPALQSFLFRLLANREDAEDLVHETYLRAFEKLATFEERSSFKTWVFTIALNLGRNHLAREKRWSTETQNIVAGMHTNSTALMNDLWRVFREGPEETFEIKEHIDYCFTCTNKTLPVEQQICLLLKEIYGFRIGDIVLIAGMSEGRVKHALSDARSAMREIFAGKCAFVNKQGVCHQCTTLQGILNPDQIARGESNRNRLEKSPDRDTEHLLELRMAIVRDVDPLHAGNSALHAYLLENNPAWVALHLQSTQTKKNAESPSDPGAPIV